ncbi:MAG: cupredoxin family copper-binding protein [Nanoarchaeota archaeon]
MKKAIFLVLLIILGLLITGCSKQETAPVEETAPVVEKQGDEKGVSAGGEAASVIIKNFKFVPSEIKVKVGTEVTWRNDDSVSHTVESIDGVLASDNLEQGDSVTFTFNSPGRTDYICGIHPSMKGAVIVQ